MEFHQDISVLSLQLLTKLDQHLSSMSSPSAKIQVMENSYHALVNCLSVCLCAVRSWPFFLVCVKLSAYCCKFIELYLHDQVLAVFLSPVAFFPSLNPEFNALVADVPSERNYISNVGNKNWCVVWLHAVGAGIGIGHGKEDFKAVCSGES